VGDSSSEVFCAKFDPEDRYIACGYGDGVIRVFNLETGKLAFNLASGAGSSSFLDEMPVTGLRWRPQSAQLKTMNVLVAV
jgi:WD40 repeat protein